MNNQNNLSEIKREIIKNEDITIFKISGNFTLEEILNTANYFYKEELTNNVIYDLTEATFIKINIDKVIEVVKLTTKHANKLRTKGKTAIITADASSFGLSRMYEQMTEKKKHPVKHAVFKTISEALIWIKTP